MRHPATGWTALALAVWLGAAAASGEDWSGPVSVGVEVQGHRSGPAAGARVLFTYQGPLGDGGPAPVATDDRGKAVVAGLAEGPWRVRIDHPDYLSWIGNVELSERRKPKVTASFLEAGTGSLTPVRVKLFAASGQAASPPIEPRAPAPKERPSPAAQPSPPTAAPPQPPPAAPSPEPEAPPVETPSPVEPPKPEPRVPPPPPASTAEPEPRPAVPPAETAPLPEPELPAAQPEPPMPATPPAPAPAPEGPGEAEIAKPREPSEPAPPPTPEKAPDADVAPEAETPAPATPPAPAVAAREPEAPRAPAEAPAPVEAPELAAPLPESEEPQPAVEPPAPTPEPTAPEPTPEPSAPEPTPEAPPPPPAETPRGPAVVPAPPPMGAVLGSRRDGTCAACRSGEWSASTEAVAGARSEATLSDCPQGLQAAAKRAAGILVGAAELESFVGPVWGPGEAIAVDLLSAADRASLEKTIGAYSGPGAACTWLAVVLPAGARFIGFRFEAADTVDGGDCLPIRGCPIGESRWTGSPSIERGAGATVVHAVFVNQSSERQRRARLTAYFLPPHAGWSPPR